MFLDRKNPACIRCQVIASQSQYILATEGSCRSLNQNPKFLQQGNIYIADSAKKTTSQFMFIEFKRLLPLSVM